MIDPLALKRVWMDSVPSASEDSDPGYVNRWPIGPKSITKRGGDSQDVEFSQSRQIRNPPTVNLFLNFV